MDGHTKANFISAFEHFCNDWRLTGEHVRLIVCGSATSWVVDKMLGDKGGLYGRVASKVYVKPFTLKECRECFICEGFHMDSYDILFCMALGGIPYAGLVRVKTGPKHYNAGCGSANTCEHGMPGIWLEKLHGN